MGHAPGRAGGRLVGGVAFRSGERGTRLVPVLVGVGPEPLLPRLEAADHRVPRLAVMRGGVLGRRGVAAADVPALGAPAQVHPPAASLLALRAAGAGWGGVRVDT